MSTHNMAQSSEVGQLRLILEDVDVGEALNAKGLSNVF